jgi:hypothetical protein
MLTFILLLALAETQPIAFDASRWTLVGHGATTMTYLERPSLFIDNGVALLRDSSFGDGTIEFDVALHGHASFAGVAFRALSADDYELVYLRPHLSRRPDAVQYTPIYNGAEAWQLYSGPGYTAEAELPLNRWLHVKLSVSGYTARLFVDGAASPQLTVTSLKRPWTRGMIGLWGSLGGANFSNVIVSPDDTSAPAMRPAESSPSADTLTKWELSPAFETTAVKDDVLPDRATLPASAWTRVTAESSGLVNVAEYRRRTRTSASSLALVFARSIITASRAEQRKLVFAYSDRVHIFLNGRLLFAGDNVFQSRDPSFLGVASLGPDAIYVELRPGPNEIVFAVSEKFGGWGFAARLEPLQADATSVNQIEVPSTLTAASLSIFTAVFIAVA